MTLSRPPARGPNGALRRLLAEVGWTEERLASNVSELAAATGVPLRLDPGAVARWLAGGSPAQPVPSLVAEALSRGLGRPVTVAATGLDPGSGERAAPADVPARDPVTVGDARPGDPADGPRGPVAPPTPQRTARAHPRTPAPDAEAMVRAFSAIDDGFGGGHSRGALVAYLARDLGPRLADIGAGRASRSGLWSAATQLTYRCGFMCFDENLHDLARRYYRVALDLASATGDSGARAVILRTMSNQARLLGHRRYAVHLAEAAMVTGGRSVSPARSAFLLGQVAVAAAGAGDRTNAVSSLSAAERQLSRATSRSTADDAADTAGTAMGGYHPAALWHQQAAVRALLGDRAGAITALTVSLTHRPAEERRSRTITRARLAELQLSHGEVDQAVTTWHAFLDDYRHLRSGRATTALRTLRSRLAPHAADRNVAGLLTRAVAESRPRTR